MEPRAKQSSILSLLQVAADLFQRAEQRGVPVVVMPAIGGLATGLMALLYPEVLYQGFGNVNAILQNRDHFAPLLLFQILAVKIFCTSVSKGSGLVGGIYAPSIFMGKAPCCNAFRNRMSCSAQA